MLVMRYNKRQREERENYGKVVLFYMRKLLMHFITNIIFTQYKNCHFILLMLGLLV